MCAGLALTASATAAQPNVQKCLELTTASSLNTKKIVAGLGLPPDQLKELRSRLVSYGSVRGFAGLDGLGLTPDQVALINQRIDAQVAVWNAHPLGWPCSPFKHRQQVVRFMRAKLIANGFRPASIVFQMKSPRQVQFVGIQDGVSLIGTVAKSGKRQIIVSLTSPDFGQTVRFTVPFES